MTIYQAISAPQETPTEAILAPIHAMDILAGYTKFLI
jgi:hypothetical protein